MTKSRAALLLQAAAKASKAGSKVDACERRLAKLRKECERYEAEYLTAVAATFATKAPTSSQHTTGGEGPAPNPA